MIIIGALIDLTGQRFGRYTVICQMKERKNRQVIWKCQCDCGNIRFIQGEDLRSGKTKSCGCYRDEWCKTASKTHGLSGTRIYRTWLGMKKRCQNPNEKEYKDYGGRGITICREWENSFETFYEWAIHNGYTDELTIDRIDVNGNYTPTNCRFITKLEQANNKTDNHFITYNGETHTISEWERKLGVNYGTIKSRINKLHWSVEDALTKPIRKLKRPIHN